MNHTPSILITGASGFIGSFLVEKALKKGYQVWAGVRESSNREYLQDSRIQFIDLEFKNKSNLIKQLQDFKQKYGGFDYIIHNAGVTKCLNKNDFEKINFLYIANLIDALIATDSIPQKFVLMSSLSVMGNADKKGYIPFKIDDIPNPSTVYGISKLKAENYLRNQNSLPYMIFRPTGVYGPREKDYFLMLKTVQKGLDIGAGLKAQHLTFIYVKDLVDVVFSGLNSKLINKTYFVADGEVYTEKEYTGIIKKALGKKQVISIKIPLCLLKTISLVSDLIARLIKTPSTLNLDKYKIMKQRNWECDITPLIEDLSFKAQYDLKRGIEESLKWYKKNDWLK